MGLADAPILASSAEAVLLVIQAGSTRKGTAANAVKRLQSARANILGVLINRFERKHAGYGYGAGNGYDSHDYYTYGADDRKKIGT